MPIRIRHPFTAVFIVTLPVMLAACDMLSPGPRITAPPPVPVPSEPAPGPEAKPVARPAPLPTRKPAPQAQPTAQPAPQVVPVSPITIIGLNRDELQRHFGMPVAEREAAPARVLEFGNGDCRLAAYLYFDTARNDFYTLQYEVNGAAPAGPAAEQCLSRIARDAERR